MATMNPGLLPTIKCSSCGFNVEIMAMGDHICDNSTQASSSPPSLPPPTFDHEIPPRSAARPAPIDPSRANQPFLHAEVDIRDVDALTPSPLSFSNGQRSPLATQQRSQTTPLPQEAQSPDLTGAFPTFPLPRSMSTRRPHGMAVLNDPNTAPAIPSPQYATAGTEDFNRPPATAQFPLDTDDQVPPLPLPKDDIHALNSTSHGHKYGASIDSKSSYRTSLASSRYGENASKRSTAISSRRPSFGSASYAYKYLDDVPPIPPSIPHMSAFSDSSVSDIFPRHDGKGDSLNGLDPRSSGEQAFHKREAEKPLPSPLRPSSNTNSERLSSSRGSAELFFRSPSQSTHGPPIDFPDPSELRSHSVSSSNHSYKAFRPSGSDHLHPTDAEQHHDESQASQRKNSDANSESNLSVSNFARALGLDGAGHAAESSTVSSDSSPSDSRSGTSFSSVASEGSSRRKLSDQGRLGPVVEEIKTDSHLPPVLDESLHTESPIDLEPPRIPGPLFSPDSPTDPSINMGGMTLLSDQSKKNIKEPNDDLLEKPAMIRSATEPVARPSPRPKGKCRGCGEMIMGKSVSSADGRLTGRYHRACFVCYDCRTPFQTADFYVLGDRPFCAQHYHERNGSVCHNCHTGIEGQYLQTMERTGRGPTDTQKFHPECLTCRTCNILLKGEYFEWNGLVYCERDARRAAASVSPHRFRRPTMPSSPLAHSRGYSRGYPPPPPAGYPGPGMRPYGPGPGPGPGPSLRPPAASFDSGPYPPPPSPGARRFPERRTTRLMMI